MTAEKDLIGYTPLMAELNKDYKTIYDQYEERLLRQVNAGQLHDSARVHILELVSELVEARGMLDFERGRKYPFRFFSISWWIQKIKSKKETKKIDKVVIEALRTQLNERADKGWV